MTGQSARFILAKNLRIIRLIRNLSQDDMARLVGMDRSYLGGIERGERNVSLDNVEKLALSLGVGLPELLREPDSKQVASDLAEAIDRFFEGGTLKIRDEGAIYGA